MYKYGDAYSRRKPHIKYKDGQWVVQIYPLKKYGQTVLFGYTKKFRKIRLALSLVTGLYARYGGTYGE